MDIGAEDEGFGWVVFRSRARRLSQALPSLACDAAASCGSRARSSFVAEACVFMINKERLRSFRTIHCACVLFPT
jgi:hypothetical protein